MTFGKLGFLPGLSFHCQEDEGVVTNDNAD